MVSTIPQNTKITSVINPTTVTISSPASVAGSGVLVLGGPYIVDIINPTTAILNVPAIASGNNGILTIGYTDQGYPLADQPGRGSFPSANAGNWPHSSSYSEADYEELAPIYLFMNRWQTVDSGLNILTDNIPPASEAGLEGSQAYIKHLREWYDDSDILSGTSLPLTGTKNYAFWRTDEQKLYKCISDNVWVPFYTPYIYPHPLTLVN